MSATLHILLVLYSAGLGPRGVVRFHREVAGTELSLGGALAGNVRLALDLAHVDRPLGGDDFLGDDSGRRRLSPSTVLADLERRGVSSRRYPLLLAFFRAPDGVTTHALAIEREGETLQVSLASQASVSLEDALAEALSVLLNESGSASSGKESSLDRGSLPETLQLLRSLPQSAWSRLVTAGGLPPAARGLTPVFQRVVIPSGNRSVFLSFVGRAEEKPRLRLGLKTATLEPLSAGRGEAWGAWIDLPSGQGTEEAAVGGVPLTPVERQRVGYVAARWKESASGSGPAILEADVREEALGGSLRIPGAKLTVKGEAKLVLREFPGGAHMGQREEGPLPVEVAGELAGFRLKPARLSGEPELAGATSTTASPPSGAWILGVVRP